MEEHIWDTSGSYLRGIAVYFLYSPNARKKTLFWRDAKIGFIYSLKCSGNYPLHFCMLIQSFLK